MFADPCSRPAVCCPVEIITGVAHLFKWKVKTTEKITKVERCLISFCISFLK